MLFNKNLWDDLDIIDQGHSKCNVSKFRLNRGYFNKISTKMMASRPIKKKSYHLTLKYRTRLPVTEIALSQLLYNRFLPNLHRNDGNMVGNKNVTSADFQNVGEGHRLQKSL